jgi:hypothetical protein
VDDGGEVAHRYGGVAMLLDGIAGGPELSPYDLGARFPRAPSPVWPNGYDAWAAV